MISRKQEDIKKLNKISDEIFSNNDNLYKINIFKELCCMVEDFIPSERCREKQCILGKSCGNLDAKIMFITEAPLINGVKIPIYGNSTGDNFETILDKGSKGAFARKDIFITNVFLWDLIDEKGHSNKPTYEEIDKCLPFLKFQIQLVQPELIIALGDTVLKILEKINPIPQEVRQMPLKEMVGNMIKWTDNNCLLSVMYYPSSEVIATCRTINEMINDFRSILKSYIKLRPGFIA